MINSSNFESLEMKVDYISFNLLSGKNNYKKIVKYLHTYHGFNCYLYYGKTRIRKAYLVNSDYKHKMMVVFNINPVNSNTVGIQFSGVNAEQFYSILKTLKLDWSIFNLENLKLSRFDISYIRINCLTNKFNLLDFYQRSSNKFKKRYPNSEAQIIDCSLSLATRTGDYFFRIYVPKYQQNDLKFELEIKKYKAKSLLKYLINNSFIEFEKSMVESFFRYLKIALVFDTHYTDWLTFQLRKTNKPKNSLVSNYFQDILGIDSLDNKLTFYRMLQFLSFSRTCSFKQEKLNGEIYRSFNFPLIDFAKQINLYPLNTYQRKKLIQFFREFQRSAILQWIDDSQFISLVSCPVIRIENKNSKYTKIIIYISISELLYQWEYPFCFPYSFYNFENINDLKLKFSIIRAISIKKSTRKILYFEGIFSGLNNQNKAFMKSNLIELFKELTDGGFIENKFKLKQDDNQIIIADKLTINFLHSTKQLIFYESLK